jgi:hypothetical protein
MHLSELIIGMLARKKMMTDEDLAVVKKWIQRSSYCELDNFKCLVHVITTW